LRTATDETASELAELADPMLAQRADDVRSLGRRAAADAAGVTRRAGEGVLIATTLGPADVAEFAALARGIALAGGGVTSHAAIVARSLGLPMVVGLGSEIFDIGDGEELVIDGDRGILVSQPQPERLASARAAGEQRRVARQEAIARRDEIAQTKDGRRIHVLTNASTVAELEEAMRQGAEGVGLLRTELLFLEASSWPSLQQQVNVLRPVLARLAGITATVRLFDFGGDKTPPFLRGVTARGIELLLDTPDAMRTHLDAVVQAAKGTDLRILVPMVTTAEQMRAVRSRLDGMGRLQVGAMIETPEAATAAYAIARECDFLSIGTNDLTQLVLGLDREQSRRAPVLDSRVLSLIDQTMRAGRAARIPIDVCGEAASDASALPIMVGFGADELSVAPARVGQVRQWIRELDFAEAAKESEKLLHEAGHARRERV
jgi:phosphoenolpyruvate-protein kinase (PTS system EI component)